MSEAISPKQLYKEGKSAYEAGDFHAAALSFEAAAQGYLGMSDEVMAAEMRNNRSVALLQAGEAEDALQAVDGTIAVFEAAGDKRRQGMALGNLGAALEAVDRLEDAGEAYQQSADLLKEAGEEDLLIHVVRSQSALQLRTGRQLEALGTMQAGLERVDRPTTKQRLLKRLLNIPSKLLNKS